MVTVFESKIIYLCFKSFIIVIPTTHLWLSGLLVSF